MPLLQFSQKAVQEGTSVADRFQQGKRHTFPHYDDRCVWIYTPYSKWRIVSVENTGKFILCHKNTFETPHDMDSLIPGDHIQKTKKSNILGYFKYIVEHEYYRMTHPVCPPQRAKKRQPPRKGTKRYKNQKRREARYEKKAGDQKCAEYDRLSVGARNTGMCQSCLIKI